VKHTRIAEEFHRADGPVNSIYLTYDTGHVICYGPDVTANRRGLWIASVWTAHPLDEPDKAEHINHLAADSEWVDFVRNLRHWERTGEIR
jgi:hypothetical protein